MLATLRPRSSLDEVAIRGASTSPAGARRCVSPESCMRSLAVTRAASVVPHSLKIASDSALPSREDHVKTLPVTPVKMTGLVAVVAALVATVVSLSGDARASEVPFTPATSPSIAPASAPIIVASKAPVTLMPDPPVVVPAPAATAAKPAPKPATTTKKPVTTTTKKVVAPAAPKPVVKPPVPINPPGGFGTTDPSKVGQYCTIINGHYYGNLCPKPEGSPV